MWSTSSPSVVGSPTIVASVFLRRRLLVLRWTVPAVILVVCLLSGCTDAENGEITDLAHAAVHEMRLKIDECGDSPSCDGEESTSALAVVAWTGENDERVDAYPTDDGVMINFPDGSILTTEHFPESGRLRSWTVR